MALTVFTCVVLIACMVRLWRDREAVLWISIAALMVMVVVLGSELRRMQAGKQIADRANMAKGRFLANISEAIRTPTDGIVGMTDLLLLSGLTPDQEHFAATVKTSARALLKVLNQMLDFARIIDGQVQFTECDFELHEVIDNAAGRHTAAAADKGLTLHCHIAPNLPEVVRGDPVRLQQVLDQIVGNAVKFTSEGEVRVCARWLGDTENAHILQLEVQDTGPGIGRQERARIFDSYAGVRGDNKQVQSGGMGLAIAKQIVASARGSLDFQSEPGRGSTFWVVLPLGRSSLDLPRLHRALTLSGARVLLVCRSESLRHLLDDYCRSFGMTVQDGTEPDGEADLVITDREDYRRGDGDGPLLFIARTGSTAGPGTALRMPIRRRDLESTVMALLADRMMAELAGMGRS